MTQQSQPGSGAIQRKMIAPGSTNCRRSRFDAQFSPWDAGFPGASCSAIRSAGEHVSRRPPIGSAWQRLPGHAFVICDDARLGARIVIEEGDLPRYRSSAMSGEA